MGICGTFASGIQESTRTGSTFKILHGGWGAHARHPGDRPGDGGHHRAGQRIRRQVRLPPDASDAGEGQTRLRQGGRHSAFRSTGQSCSLASRIFVERPIYKKFATAIAERIEAGLVSVNTFRPVHFMLPYGGYKLSGFGRKNGLDAIRDYTEVKTVVIDLASEMPADPFAD